MAYRKQIPKATRMAVWERDGGQCTRCGSADDLVIHHILPVSEGGANDLDNLRLLCMPCHKAVHAERGDWYAAHMAESMADLPGRPRGSRRRPPFPPRVKEVPDILELQKKYKLTDQQALVWRRLYLFGVWPTAEEYAECYGEDPAKVTEIARSLFRKRLVALVCCGGREMFRAGLPEHFSPPVRRNKKRRVS